MSQVTLGGNPIEVSGTFPSAGQQAPDFTLVGADLGDVTLAKFAGKRKVLNIVPSLDTPTCATSTRKFNEAAAKLDNTVVVVVSGDLPFAAKRFCVTEGLENVVTASTFRGTDFAKADFLGHLNRIYGRGEGAPSGGLKGDYGFIVE